MKKKLLAVLLIAALLCTGTAFAYTPEYGIYDEEIPPQVLRNLDNFCERAISFAGDDLYTVPDGVDINDLEVLSVYKEYMPVVTSLAECEDLEQAEKTCNWIVEMGVDGVSIVEAHIDTTYDRCIDWCYQQCSGLYSPRMADIKADGNTPTNIVMSVDGTYIVAVTPSGERILYPYGWLAEKNTGGDDPISFSRCTYNYLCVYLYNQRWLEEHAEEYDNQSGGYGGAAVRFLPDIPQEFIEELTIVEPVDYVPAAVTVTEPEVPARETNLWIPAVLLIAILAASGVAMWIFRRRKIS